MHERTQRRICRVVYVLACILPTVLAVAFVLYFHRPWQERDWQHLLESNLHVRASISQVTAPRPGERKLYDVRLADLLSRKEIASVDKLQLLSNASLHAEQINVTFHDLESLTRTVQSWLGTDELTALNFTIEKLLLSHGSDETCELTNVRIAFDDTTTQKRKLKLQADVSTDEAKQAHVRLQVEHTPTGPWDISLDCREAQLPAYFFAEFLPGAARWKDAHFNGIMQLRCGINGVEGTLEGKFSPINLQAWLGDDSPHQLRATANLQLDKLRWLNFRVVEAQGSLNSEPGQMSRSLIAALANSPYCVPSKKLADSSSPDTISFEKLGCNFDMNASGLSIKGNCLTPSPEMPGCLLVSDVEPLLVQPTCPHVPLPYFVQVFCPLDKYWLPGMRKAADLAEVLPQPEQEIVKK